MIVILFARDGISEAEPYCSSSSSTYSDIITFTCSLVYSGNWSPAARWQQFTETNESLGDPVTMTTDFDNFVHNKNISFEFSVNVTISNIDTKYRCTIYFDASQRPKHVSADNVPSYEHVWMSELIRNAMVTVQNTMVTVPLPQSTYSTGVFNYSRDYIALL